MAKFGRASRERLYTCRSPLIVLFEEVIKVFDCSILCGSRNREEQDALFYMDPPRTRCKWPDSSHNVEEGKEGEEALSMAVDAAPYYAEMPHTRWDEDSLRRWYYFGGRVVEMARHLSIPIRWGGDWDMDTYVLDQKLMDLPHFELIP
uniref:Putative peptidase n=1 Tax=viral metagenome TaxID=1070528 RepID=A0A6M3ME16_9ZZZZ